MATSRSIVTAGILLAGLASPVYPCSVLELLKPADLVRQAEVIVRARAERVSAQPGRPGTLAASSTQIEFNIVAVLKGALPADRITFNGVLVGRDEKNPGAVPYSAARHSADASCFALAYRQGGEYLLFLKRDAHPSYVQGRQLTPYWAPLAPSNEQVFGAGDQWEAWVRGQLRNAGDARPAAR